jgi:hypothetical protein
MANTASTGCTATAMLRHPPSHPTPDPPLPHPLLHPTATCAPPFPTHLSSGGFLYETYNNRESHAHASLSRLFGVRARCNSFTTKVSPVFACFRPVWASLGLKSRLLVFNFWPFSFMA